MGHVHPTCVSGREKIGRRRRTALRRHLAIGRQLQAADGLTNAGPEADAA